MDSYIKKWIALLGVLQVLVISYGVIFCSASIRFFGEVMLGAPRLTYWMRDHGTILLAIPLIWSALAGLSWKEDSPSQWNEPLWLGSGIIITLLLTILVMRASMPVTTWQ